MANMNIDTANFCCVSMDQYESTGIHTTRAVHPIKLCDIPTSNYHFRDIIQPTICLSHRQHHINGNGNPDLYGITSQTDNGGKVVQLKQNIIYIYLNIYICKPWKQNSRHQKQNFKYLYDVNCSWSLEVLDNVATMIIKLLWDHTNHNHGHPYMSQHNVNMLIIVAENKRIRTDQSNDICDLFHFQPNLIKQ